MPNGEGRRTNEGVVAAAAKAAHNPVGITNPPVDGLRDHRYTWQPAVALGEGRKAAEKPAARRGHFTRSLTKTLRACMNRCMKTITLDEQAYQRLRAWKQSKGDSFSKVVKRVVPEAGTLGAMEQYVSRRNPDPEKDHLMEESIEQRTPARHDPWT